MLGGGDRPGIDAQGIEPVDEETAEARVRAMPQQGPDLIGMPQSD
jgi:hypothetical protein